MIYHFKFVKPDFFFHLFQIGTKPKLAKLSSQNQRSQPKRSFRQYFPFFDDLSIIGCLLMLWWRNYLRFTNKVMLFSKTLHSKFNTIWSKILYYSILSVVINTLQIDSVQLIRMYSYRSRKCTNHLINIFQTKTNWYLVGLKITCISHHICILKNSNWLMLFLKSLLTLSLTG